ncbi:LysE family translocator [Hyphomicrobium sp.]|uniref:LysE family translocator n=1 Tax=Hyphomicrobium sp. TaxID=82 RepID=UPI002E35186C|nr:LysE family translocator [Hyphomicrobium sp.]HEX2841210.1 LysE family translocator [Hyphomicrobium sp.]
MPTDIVLALIGFAIAGSITPGPNNLLVLTSGLNHGVGRTVPLIAGISFGFAFMLVAIGIGLGSLIRSYPGLHTAIKVFGLAYMLWLAWRVASSTPASDTADNTSLSEPLSAFTGATFQWVNPKAWAIALSATAAFSVADAATESLAWISGVFIIVAFFSLSAWAAFGSLMRRLIDSPSKMRTFNLVMALLLVASALPVAYDLFVHH